MNNRNDPQMLIFDIVRLDRLVDADLFNFCIAFDAEIEDVAEHVILYESNNIGVGKSSQVGDWSSNEDNEISKFKELTGFGEAIIKLQELLSKSKERHFISIKVGPVEVSYQIFNREKALQYLVKEIGQKYFY